MRPIYRTYTLVAGATGAIAASQTPGAAGNLLINGTLASGGVATMDTQRQVAITSAANLSGITFTVFGTDAQNRKISETITGPNATTTTSVLNYLTVTQITVSGAAGGALTVDTNGVGGNQEIPLDLNHAVDNISLAVEVSGTVNYTVQYTFDDIYATTKAAGQNTGCPVPTGPFIWINSATQAAQTANTNAILPSTIGPVTAVRLVTNSGTGSVTFIVNQQGLL